MADSKKNPQRALASDPSTQGRLADDLFLEAQEAEANGRGAPLNPQDFGLSGGGPDDPTQRIDTDRARALSRPGLPGRMPPAAWAEPSSGPPNFNVNIPGDATLIESTPPFEEPEAAHPGQTVEDGIVILGPQTAAQNVGIEVELLEPEELVDVAPRRLQIPVDETQVDRASQADFHDPFSDEHDKPTTRHAWDGLRSADAVADNYAPPPPATQSGEVEWPAKPPPHASAISPAEAMVPSPVPVAPAASGVPIGAITPIAPAATAPLPVPEPPGVLAIPTPTAGLNPPRSPPPELGGIRGLPLGSRPRPPSNPAAPVAAAAVPGALTPQAVQSLENANMPSLSGFGSTDASGAPVPVPALPCVLLIVGDDLQAASAIATRYMGHGYTCRVAQAAQARSILAQESVDAVAIDLTGDPALAASRLVALGDVTLPTIGFGEGSAWEGAPIEAFVLPEAADAELVGTLERVRHPLSLPAGASMDLLPALGFVWLQTVVRVAFFPAEGGQRPGRLVALAQDGRLQIEVDGEVEENTTFDVQLTLPDGRSTVIKANLETVVPGALVVALRVEPETEPFYENFQAAAASATADQLDPVVLRARATERAVDIPASRMELSRQFASIRDQLDDDDAHQAFIQACLKAQSLQFAVGSYRQLKEENPEDERVAKYLNQVGTILGFYAFKKQVDVGAPTMPTSIKWMLGIFLFVGLLSAATAVIMSLRG